MATTNASLWQEVLVSREVTMERVISIDHSYSDFGRDVTLGRGMFANHKNTA